METLSSSTFLFEISPLLIEKFCNIIDSGDGNLGWRGFASRILPNWLEMRLAERLAAAGKSPTREVLWRWGLQNKTLGDLLGVLEEMGHRKAAELFATAPSRTNLDHRQYSLSERKGNGICLQALCEAEHKESLPNQETAGFSPREHRAFILDCEQDSLITYSDVLVGTLHFHPSCKIAEGPLSELYRGTKGGVVFAAKMFKQQKNRDLWSPQWKLFQREVQILQSYRHPNILELWGYFWEGDTYCLVRPYLANGSLFDRLHSRGVGEPLSCQTRLDIIDGTSKAVHYLHTARPTVVVCGNITSANILLDDGLKPKLCDFGTAHLRPHSVTQSGIVTMVTASHGTLGYLPEEYIRNGKLSVGVDVYSLGVIILETLTGQVVQEARTRTHLADRLREALEGTSSLDTCLQWLDPTAGSWIPQTAQTLLGLALECTAVRARSRPGTETVLKVLCELQDRPRPLENPTPSLPVEDDETQPLRLASPQPRPCECSQSEVTYLSSAPAQEADDMTATRGSPWSWEGLDLCSCQPVHSNCAAEADSLRSYNCKASGFVPAQLHIHEATQHGAYGITEDIVESPAKARLREKIQQYNQGQINTQELLSMELGCDRSAGGQHM
ncbi:interleukin-1 receptor-associated kinase 3 [Brienomyrus brachyistius]|uniref:interleukin-1 receptor-associated kinase 3 n=1 Tax=Brienomyrus brachyistius TaxID=42636 RepID=UPI0020B41556|nr:interleukin-1 receptor-associated kinase 3 [Brienomyrus brachyistius]